MELVEVKESHYSDIVDIFNYYIKNTNARFETELMTVADRLDWFRSFKCNPKHKLVVACLDGKVVGFACSQKYRPNAAFDDTVEVTIYINPDFKGSGLGSSLYGFLFDLVEGSGIHRMVSGIALPNDASIAIHKKFGFTEIGVFQEYAKKNGRYISSVWMERKFSG